MKRRSAGSQWAWPVRAGSGTSPVTAIGGSARCIVCACRRRRERGPPLKSEPRRAHALAGFWFLLRAFRVSRRPRPNRAAFTASSASRAPNGPRAAAGWYEAVRNKITIQPGRALRKTDTGLRVAGRSQRDRPVRRRPRTSLGAPCRKSRPGHRPSPGVEPPRSTSRWRQSRCPPHRKFMELLQ